MELQHRLENLQAHDLEDLAGGHGITTARNAAAQGESAFGNSANTADSTRLARIGARAYNAFGPEAAAWVYESYRTGYNFTAMTIGGPTIREDDFIKSLGTGLSDVLEPKQINQIRRELSKLYDEF